MTSVAVIGETDVKSRHRIRKMGKAYPIFKRSIGSVMGTAQYAIGSVMSSSEYAAHWILAVGSKGYYEAKSALTEFLMGTMEVNPGRPEAKMVLDANYFQGNIVVYFYRENENAQPVLAIVAVDARGGRHDITRRVFEGLKFRNVEYVNVTIDGANVNAVANLYGAFANDAGAAASRAAAILNRAISVAIKEGIVEANENAKKEAATLVRSASKELLENLVPLTAATNAVTGELSISDIMELLSHLGGGG